MQNNEKIGVYVALIWVSAYNETLSCNDWEWDF